MRFSLAPSPCLLYQIEGGDKPDPVIVDYTNRSLAFLRLDKNVRYVTVCPRCAEMFVSSLLSGYGGFQP